MDALQLGSNGPQVVKLQKKLQKAGFNPGDTDGDFGPATQAAILAYQKSEGLLADGVAGPRTLEALGLTKDDSLPSVVQDVTSRIVSEMFPFTPVDHIDANLPAVLAAMEEVELGDKPMILMALATIRAETETFQPVSEGTSKFNTSPGGHPFDLYDNRRDLGNQGPPDGEQFRGRGFVQLTGRVNYQSCGKLIGLGDQLTKKPELANDPKIAAQLLAAFLKGKERQIKEALLDNDLKTARRLVNGGSHGLDRFSDAYMRGDALLI